MQAIETGKRARRCAVRTSGARSRFSIALSFASLAACAGREESPAHLRERTDAALSSATSFLSSHQSPDGAWRSATYGALKDGLSLTPPVLKALIFAPPSPESAARVRPAIEYLVRAVRADGTIDPGPDGWLYPVYTSSLAVIALTRGGGEELVHARDAWLAFLRSHQLDERLGWGRDDPAFGGWGYALVPLKKSAKLVEDLYDADLSSTLFALGALRIAGAPASDPEVVNARAFVLRCQNFAEDEVGADARFDDGGFFFTPTNALQNKAGLAGVDRSGRTRYSSYGSMTADGVRALLRCGFAADDPRVLAARRWIERNFDVASNPGRFEAVREVERDASYFYYVWSLAHALQALGLDAVETPRGRIEWRAALATELIARQRVDGSWRNTYSMVKEDDPLIATAFAAAALAICRLQAVPSRG